MNAAVQSSHFWWIAGVSVLTAGAAIGIAAFIFVLSAAARQRLMPHLLSFSIGTLLGAAFLGLLPHALDRVPAASLFPVLLAGIVAFMILERLMLWRHCHDGTCEAHTASGPLILTGDAMHNLVDGVLIAATFFVSIPLGIATALAILSHEIPQELGDFAILLHNGYSPKRALVLNGVASAATPVGALLAWIWLPKVQAAVPYIMAVAAAGFIYVAMADLVPGLHRCSRLWQHALQLALIVAGMVIIGLFQLGNHAH